METGTQTLNHYATVFRAVAYKLPFAFLTVGIAEVLYYLHMIPGGVIEMLEAAKALPYVGEIFVRFPLFLTVALAVFMDTLFGMNAAFDRGERFQYSKFFKGITRKLLEYWLTLLVAILAAENMRGEAFYDEFITFIRNGIFVGILYAEADSAMRHTNIRLRRILRAVFERAAKRFGNGNGNGNGNGRETPEE